MDAKVLQTIERLERFMATTDDALALPRPAAEFVHALVVARGVRRAVEIGTSYGYSGLWIAAGLVRSEGSLTTIDHDPRKRDEARSNFMAAGLASSVDLRVGKALDVVMELEGPIDFVLNDADKENCRRYVELLAPKLSDRGIILTDNTITHADQMAEFVGWIRGREDFVSADVPIGNGMELSVKIGF